MIIRNTLRFSVSSVKKLPLLLKQPFTVTWKRICHIFAKVISSYFRNMNSICKEPSRNFYSFNLWEILDTCTRYRWDSRFFTLAFVEEADWALVSVRDRKWNSCPSSCSQSLSCPYKFSVFSKLDGCQAYIHGSCWRTFVPKFGLHAQF